MSTEPTLPTPKYRYTLVITGNTHDEITKELGYQLRGGYLLDSDHETRDEFTVFGGRKTSTLECTNPDQTPEQYERELDDWWQARKAARS